MSQTRHRPARLASAALAAALPVLAGLPACDGVPGDPRAMLQRVPADARFVVALDIAALRDADLARDLGLGETLAGPYEEMLAEMRAGLGVDADRIERVVVSGAWNGESPWILGEAWGGFDLDAIAEALRRQGLVEGVRDGRPAFARKAGDDAPNMILVLESSRHLRLGTSGGHDRLPRGNGGTLATTLEGNPLLGLLGGRVDAFALTLDPAIDPELLEGAPGGGMVGPLLASLEGMSGALTLGRGVTLAARVITRREADAETMAALMRGGLDVAREQLRRTGDDDVAAALDAVAVTTAGPVLTIEARLDGAMIRRFRDLAGRASR